MYAKISHDILGYTKAFKHSWRRRLMLLFKQIEQALLPGGESFGHMHKLLIAFLQDEQLEQLISVNIIRVLMIYHLLNQKYSHRATATVLTASWQCPNFTF